MSASDASGPDSGAASWLDPTGELREVVGDCVHCGFCLTACPTRLRLLLGPLRAAQRTGADRLLRGKLAERLVPEVAAALRVAPGRPPTRRAGLGRSAGRHPRGRLPEFVAARGERRAVVGMLTGCVQQGFFPQVNLATGRALAC